METLQRILAGVVGVVQWRVVAAEDQLDSLEAHHPVRLRPATVVADRHPDHAAESSPYTELMAGLEKVPFGVLERTPRFIVLVTGDVDLAVTPDHTAVTLNQDLGVVTMGGTVVVGADLGVPEAEPDPEATSLIEEGLRRRARHLGLEPGHDFFFVLDEISREEGGEGQFGEDDQLGAPGMGIGEKG